VRGEFESKNWPAQDNIGICLAVDVLKATQHRAKLVGYGADSGVLEEVHIGATWRIRLNLPCATAMPPYVKLL